MSKGHQFTDAENDKKAFVTYFLSDVLSQANENVLKANYDTDGYTEIVTVTMVNRSEYLINVTADSLIGIAYDVTKFMKDK